MPQSLPQRFKFTRAMRLSRGREFMAVYEAKVKVHVGPLTVAARPNQLSHSRLGLAVSRRAGTAVARNAIKRRLREAFRLLQHDWPASVRYDLVVTARAHQPLTTVQYESALAEAVGKLHSTWTARQRTPIRSRPPRPAE